MVFKCSIPGCSHTSRTAITHCLPKDPEVKKKWCELVNRLDLVDIDDKQRYSFRVCDVHFEEDVKFPTNRNRTNLKYYAVPTLRLPAHPSTTNTSPVPCTSAGISVQPTGSALITEVQSNLVAFTDTGFSTPTDDAHRSTANTSPIPCTSAGISIQPTGSTLITEVQSNVVPLSGTSFSTPLHDESNFATNLLRSAGVTRVVNLTPKARKLYNVAKNLKKVARRLNFQNASNKKRLSEALRYAESPDFLSAKMNERSLNFIKCQLRMLKKNARGRRFTLEDKVFALSLLKQSPKAYRALQCTFALPSRKTLMNILNRVNFTVGIVPKIMQVLESSLEKMDYLDKHCVLMFDEMSLEPSLTYDKKLDEIIGFENVEQTNKLRFADHTLVFMLRGLHKKWKQPISFHFTQGGVNSQQLKVLIKKTIAEIQRIGFIVVCTVCDQHATNAAAIKKLKEESSKQSSDINIFEVNGCEIIGIYDPPHLLKGIRNNLVSNDLKFVINNAQKTASWKHIINLYELDEGDFTTRMCYKLTESHIYREKLKKMKVKHAAQVFSHQVAATMRWTVKYGREGVITESAEETASFISFMDQVFDSVNGSTFEADHGKIFRCAIKPGSPHLSFWEKAINVFKSMKFVTSKGETVPPSVKNWINTLQGFSYMWRKLQNVGFKYLCPRNINQDPLENFFGSIRSHGIRNINPTCYSFIASYKALIINNFVSHHSPGANCEYDDNNILNSLKSLLVVDESNNNDNANDQVSCEGDDTEKNNVEFLNTENVAVIATHAYIAGYIARNIKKKNWQLSYLHESASGINIHTRTFVYQ